MLLPYQQDSFAILRGESNLSEYLMLGRSATLLTAGLCLAGCGKDISETRGALLYANNCAICHGADMRGGGGAGVVGLSKTPADLTLLSRQAGGEFPRSEVIEIMQNYAKGRQPGRQMQPLTDIDSERIKRVKTKQGRKTIPRAQALLLDYLEALQRL